MENDPATPTVVEATVVNLPPSDAAAAAEFKKRMTLALEEVTRILAQARARGLIIGFQLGINPYGQDIINGITVAKYF